MSANIWDWDLEMVEVNFVVDKMQTSQKLGAEQDENSLTTEANKYSKLYKKIIENAKKE